MLQTSQCQHLVPWLPRSIGNENEVRALLFRVTDGAQPPLIATAPFIDSFIIIRFGNLMLVGKIQIEDAASR